MATKAAGDQVGWKAIIFLDHMLLAESRGGRRKQRNATKAELVTSRVRRAWRGDWGCLYAEAEVMGLTGQGGSQSPMGDGIKADVRAVEAYVGEGLLAKAVARVRGGPQVSNSPAAVEALKALLL